MGDEELGLGIKGDQITEGGEFLQLVSRILLAWGERWPGQERARFEACGGEGGRACMRFG